MKNKWTLYSYKELDNMQSLFYQAYIDLGRDKTCSQYREMNSILIEMNKRLKRK